MADDIRSATNSEALDRLVAVVDGVGDLCQQVRDHVLHGRFADALESAQALVAVLDGDMPRWKVASAWRDPDSGQAMHEIVSVLAINRPMAKLEGELRTRMIHNLGDFVSLVSHTDREGEA